MAFATPEALAAAFSSALNGADAEAVGALFTTGAVFVNFAGTRLIGRDGIIAGHRSTLAGPFAGSTVTLEDLVVIRVREDLVIFHATSVCTPGPGTPAGDLPPGRLVLVFTVVRAGIGWLAAAATSTPIAAWPTAAPA